MQISVSSLTHIKKQTVWIVFGRLTTFISDVTADSLLLTAGGTSADFTQTDIKLESFPLQQQIKCSPQCSNAAELQYRPLDSCVCTILSLCIGTDNMSTFPAGKPEMIYTATRSNVMQFSKMSVLLWSTWTPYKSNICLCPTRLELSMKLVNSSWKSRWGAGYYAASWLTGSVEGVLNCPAGECLQRSVPISVDRSQTWHQAVLIRENVKITDNSGNRHTVWWQWGVKACFHGNLLVGLLCYLFIVTNSKLCWQFYVNLTICAVELKWHCFVATLVCCVLCSQSWLTWQKAYSRNCHILTSWKT